MCMAVELVDVIIVVPQVTDQRHQDVYWFYDSLPRFMIRLQTPFTACNWHNKSQRISSAAVREAPGCTLTGHVTTSECQLHEP
jgi:hypothetical protein